MCIIIWFTLIVGNNKKFGSIITEHLKSLTGKKNPPLNCLHVIYVGAVRTLTN